MPDSILITGGAGFIGSHLTEGPAREGLSRFRCSSTASSSRCTGGEPPADFPKDAELVVGDVRDEAALDRALQDVDKVVHLAAEVGVGQSMYAVERYVSRQRSRHRRAARELIDRPVHRVVVASSMSVYGEGLYRDADGAAASRTRAPARSSGATDWDPLDAQAGR